MRLPQAELVAPAHQRRLPFATTMTATSRSSSRAAATISAGATGQPPTSPLRAGGVAWRRRWSGHARRRRSVRSHDRRQQRGGGHRLRLPRSQRREVVRVELRGRLARRDTQRLRVAVPVAIRAREASDGRPAVIAHHHVDHRRPLGVGQAGLAGVDRELLGDRVEGEQPIPAGRIAHRLLLGRRPLRLGPGRESLVQPAGRVMERVRRGIVEDDVRHLVRHDRVEVGGVVPGQVHEDGAQLRIGRGPGPLACTGAQRPEELLRGLVDEDVDRSAHGVSEQRLGSLRCRRGEVREMLRLRGRVPHPVHASLADRQGVPVEPGSVVVVKERALRAQRL